MRTERATHRHIFVMTCEEPYSPAHDPMVLGFTIGQQEPTPQVNRYLLAGSETHGRFTDEALWRVRHDALQRLLRHLDHRFDIYGYQFQGGVKRLPVSFQDRILYLERHAKSVTVGSRQGMLAMDRYIVQLVPEDFTKFQLSNGEEAWFRFLLVKPKGEAVTEGDFDSLNLTFGVDNSGSRLRCVDPAAMYPFLDTFEGMIWYTYSPRGRDIDGPHLGMCTRKSWRGMLRRLFRPGTSSSSSFLDLNSRRYPPVYCLDLAAGHGE